MPGPKFDGVSQKIILAEGPLIHAEPGGFRVDPWQSIVC